MKLLTRGRAGLAAGVLLALFAPTARAADIPGVAHITDDAGLFSTDAKRQAENKMSSSKFDRGLHFSVDTHKSAPDEWRKKYEAAGDKPAVVRDWAKSIATNDREKGPFVLIVRAMAGKATGHTVVLIDTESANRGFGKGDEDALRGFFDAAMRESAGKPPEEATRIRDAALLKATDYVINDLRGTKVTVSKDGTPLKNPTTEAKKTGMGIGGWICIGLVVLLAIWLVIGVIRALTAPSYGGGYGGGPGYGGGGGFGGGGFFTGLLGGMFGAMAGMYLYNSIMGTSYPPQAFGGEATAGDSYSGGDTGAGDYSGGSSSATDGADYGGGDAGGGGGDYGGGGGDYGGGDYGGGDYGGGGGDYGGGGDFGGGDYGGGGDF